jgi:adenylyl- and sulfurtransferase ThiI
LLLKLRSIHDVIIYHSHFTIDYGKEKHRSVDRELNSKAGAAAEEGAGTASGGGATSLGLDTITRHLRDTSLVGVPTLDVSPRPRFRVSCERFGHHAFTSVEVQRAAGDVLYGTKSHIFLKNQIHIFLPPSPPLIVSLG